MEIGGDEEDEAKPDFSKIRSPKYRLPRKWADMKPSQAFDAMLRQKGIRNNQNCVVKIDAEKYMPILVTGVGKNLHSVGGGGTRWVETEVLIARYARKEWWDWPPMCLQPYQIYDAFPHDDGAEAAALRSLKERDKKFSEQLLQMWKKKQREDAEGKVEEKGGGGGGNGGGDGNYDDNGGDKAKKDVPVGNVGFRFTKHFPNHGWFEGEVVALRPGAKGGRDRRVVYSDGDMEDMSLAQIRQAVSKSKKRKRAD